MHKIGFDVVGLNDDAFSNLTYLTNLRDQGNLAPGGHGKAVRIEGRDWHKGQHAFEEYAFNVVVSNKVS